MAIVEWLFGHNAVQAKLAKLRRDLLDPQASGGGGGGGRGEGFDVNKVGDARVGLVGAATLCPHATTCRSLPAVIQAQVDMVRRSTSWPLSSCKRKDWNHLPRRLPVCRKKHAFEQAHGIIQRGCWLRGKILHVCEDTAFDCQHNFSAAACILMSWLDIPWVLS